MDMVADNPGDVAAQTPPQKSGGAGQAGDDAPIFVNGAKEFFGGAHADLNGFDLFARTKFRGWFWCTGVAFLYMLVFALAGWFFPNLCQAWLDFCLPLTEYVGGLTPRAERITGQLIENGYAERADDALHGIAMVKVLMIPAFVCMLVGGYVAAHSSTVLVYCTLGTRIKIWLRITCSIAMILAMAALFVWALEIRGGEGFDDGTRDSGFLAKQGAYRNGNLAMFADLSGLFIISMWLWIAVLALAGMRPFRFIMVKHPPEGKS